MGAGVTCDEWAGADHNAAESECKKNPKYMNKYCMSSCCEKCFVDKDKCPTHKKRCMNFYAESSPTKTLTDAESAENNASCKKWAAAGECTKNKAWMFDNCGKECCPICVPKAPAVVPAAVAPVQWAPQYYSAPLQYSAPVAGVAAGVAAPVAAAATTTAPVANFGGYGAFGGYGGVLGSFPYRG